MKLSAIDLGFLYTKAIVNHRSLIVKSIVGDGKSLDFKDLDMVSDEDKRKKDYISSRAHGQEYFVSDLAIDQSDATYHSLKSDRFDSKAISVLVKTALGIGLGSGAHTTYVVSGLPASHYAKFKDNIKTLFMGQGQETHSFSVNYERVMGFDSMTVNTKSVLSAGTVRTVEGRFLPQPHGAAMERLLAKDGTISDKVLAGKTLAVVDPGFGTSDIYVISALSPVQKYTFSTGVAMNTAYTMISNKVAEKFNISLPLYAVESIVRTGKFIKNGQEHDMTAVIQWAYRATAQQLADEIHNHWKNTHEIDHIIVAGGGGAALYQYLVPEFPAIELIPNSQWAIVRGYEKWGRRTWKDAE